MPSHPDAVACSIDYERRFSLPFGVPSHTKDADIVQWLDASACSAGFCWPQRKATTPASRSSKSGDFKGIAVAGAPGTHMLVPPSVNPPGAIVAQVQNVSRMGRAHWVMPTAAPAALPALAAEQFHWPPHDHFLGVLPMPLLPEECLAVLWNKELPAKAPVSTPVAGIFEADSSSHLLSTGSTGIDGECDPLLLRTQTVGPVRFERYRHVLRSSSGAQSITHLSSAGAVYLESTPAALAKGKATARFLFEPAHYVFENVDLLSASACFAALTAAQIVHFDAIQAQRTLASHHTKAVITLLRCWYGWLQLGLPSGRSLVDGAAPALPAEVARLLTGTNLQRRTLPQVIDWIRSDAGAKQHMWKFIQRAWAPAICGRSWAELGVALPLDPATVQPPLRWAHNAVAGLQENPDTRPVAFAGCPLGKAARFYTTTGKFSEPPGTEILSGYDTFATEAIAIAGQLATCFPSAAPQAPPPELTPVDLKSLDHVTAGYATVFRQVPNRVQRMPAHTTLDYLGQLGKGTRRWSDEEPGVVLGPYGQAPSGFASAVGMSIHREALSDVAELAALRDATHGGLKLGQRSLDWWVQRTTLTNAGGKWLAIRMGEPVDWVDPAPAHPFGRVSRGQTRGLDWVDLEYARQAARWILDARTRHPVDTAVLLALLVSEGYGFTARYERSPTPQTFADAHYAPSYAAQKDSLAFRLSIVRTFGLDDFDKPTGDYRSYIEHVRTIIDSGLVSDFLSPEYHYEFGAARVTGSWTGPGQCLQSRRHSRRLQWLGMLWQAGWFQHRCMLVVNGLPRPGESVSYRIVDEFKSGSAPDAGVNSLDPARRAYLAYYSLLYLAFNVATSTWNAWVAHAEANKAPGETVSEYLLYSAHAHSGASEQLDPTLFVAGVRHRAHRATLIRFAVALDAFLRLNFDAPAGAQRTAPDTTDPYSRGAGW